MQLARHRMRRAPQLGWWCALALVTSGWACSGSSSNDGDTSGAGAATGDGGGATSSASGGAGATGGATIGSGGAGAAASSTGVGGGELPTSGPCVRGECADGYYCHYQLFACGTYPPDGGPPNCDAVPDAGQCLPM